MASQDAGRTAQDNGAGSGPVAARRLGSTGLTVSQAGFGCYRVDPQVEEHRLALRHALLSGINLIDTSSNYGDGGSETLVGRVLAELEGEGTLSRERVVVATKGGYIQGSNFVESQERKNQGEPWPELVEYAPGLEHCIHPDFLAAQLSASLARLGLASVEIYLLHNPEYYLGWAAKAGAPLDQARWEYHRRLHGAFVHLEKEAEAGRISFYGVSSNTFPAPANYDEFTSLDQLWRIAESISPRHRFRVIQMPLNLLETGAVTQANQPGGRSVLSLAAELGLGVLINRPLNALGPQGLFRLALNGAEARPPNQSEVQDALQELLKSEGALKLSLLPNLHLAEDEQRQVADYLSAAGLLLRSWRDLAGLEHWRQMEQYVTARLNAAFAFLARRLSQSPEGLAALDAHLMKAKTALERVLLVYACQADEKARALYQRARGLDSYWRDAASLSRLALRAARSAEGVSCVLMGMRRREYVDDALAELAEDVPQGPYAQAWRELARSDIPGGEAG